MGICSSNTAIDSSLKAANTSGGEQGMARVLKVGKPSQCDPTGTGMIVNDILTPWRFPATDPFILLHEFGPVDGGMSGKMPVGMHPHRGFNECPYLKQGHWVGTDAWKPNGDPTQPMRSGAFQWGMVGSGIEHGVNFDRSYTGPVHGFQMWVNLPAAHKMDPPCFQDAEPEALPVVALSGKAKAKVLAGSLGDAKSPVSTGSVQVQYIDFMLEAGAEVEHSVPEGYTSVFVYVYNGPGFVCNQAVKRGDALKIEACGPLSARSDKAELGFLLMAGVPLGESIVQHGPFVMATREQIQQTFRDYQSGRFLNETCKYVLHKAGQSVESCKSLPK
eukprot:TRINITY_DN22813_c0_g1_i1.p1 TRINITY_DN22813_c0_g1~~TRINITY_DN22813_c0_g1_i1.p1  ORF type:complete len:332 (-),score=42.77 TRINITY_DN22813_c0_g1_i1:32-1027(-)